MVILLVEHYARAPVRSQLRRRIAALHASASHFCTFFCPKNPICDREQLASVCEHAQFDSSCAFCCPSTRPEHASARNSDTASQRGSRQKVQNGQISNPPAARPANASRSRVCASTPDLIRRVHSPRRALGQSTRLLAAATRHRGAARVGASFSPPFRPAKRDFRPRAARECVRARPIRIVMCILLLEH